MLYCIAIITMEYQITNNVFCFVNAWNALPASAFDCDSVSGFKRFLVDCDLSQFLCQ